MENSDNRQRELQQFITLAKKRAKTWAFTSKFLWNTHAAATGVSLLLHLIVPFGLATLLYLDESGRNTLNKTLIYVSASAVILTVLDAFLGLRYRGRRLRYLYIRLEDAIAKYEDGLMDIKQFQMIYDGVSENYLDEEGV